MNCVECKNELKVIGFKNVISGSQSPDTPTELRCVQTLVCANPSCARYGTKSTVSHNLNFEEER